MKNIYSNIIKFSSKNLIEIIKILKKNGIIGLPTETVYGLAGNAYSNSAIKKIFKIKKRFKKNPLIIHYYNFNHAKKDVHLDQKFYKIYKKFSPGPITYIVKKRNNSKIKSLACANLKTVGIRFPKNKKIRKLLKKLNFPLAMPSANKSSGVSPVRPLDVFEEFHNKIKILDGGISNIGIESTVVNLVGNICILRTSSLGDICHMMPFIYTLRNEYPKAKITWIIGKNEADFLGKIDGIDFIIFDKSKTFKSYITIIKKLKDMKYDVLFIMQVSLRANIVSFFINSDVKLGYDL